METGNFSGQQHKVNTLIWGGMVLSVFFYAGISMVIPQPTPADGMGPIFAALALVGFTFAMMSNVLQHLMLRSKEPVTRDPDQIVVKAFMRYRTVMIVRTAPAESLAIFGLVIYFLGGMQNALFAMAGISLVCMLGCRPDLTKMLDYVSRQKALIGT